MKTIEILIVDDDLSFRSAQKRNLRRLHLRPDSQITVLEASNGKDAMEIIKTITPHCVLLDHNMPGGSGMVWLQKLLAVNSDLAIVMLTGQGSEQLAVEAMKNGAMDYLVKGSITPEDLSLTILNVIEKMELRQTINQQRENLIDAERHRVMIESLGTACHHIGQPATVISAYLQMMQMREIDDEMKEMIATCMEASEAMADILHQLQLVSRYRVKPYLSGSEESGDSILTID